MSTTKEMHIFDTLFMPDLCGALFYKQSLLQVHRQITSIIQNKQLTPKENIGLQNELDRLNIYHDLHEYLRYFLRLTNKIDDTHPLIKVVGEFSPTYSALSADHFLRIKNLLNADFNIKVVFLMRDPIDRIWSQQRMIEGKPSKGGIAKVVVPGEFKAKFFKHKGVVARTVFDQTIINLEQVFNKDEIFYGFYETFFVDDEIERLCDFLGISHIKANFSKKVGASQRSEETPNIDGVKEARKFYDTTYSFCAERFGEEFIRSIWKYYPI